MRMPLDICSSKGLVLLSTVVGHPFKLRRYASFMVLHVPICRVDDFELLTGDWPSSFFGLLHCTAISMDTHNPS